MARFGTGLIPARLRERGAALALALGIELLLAILLLFYLVPPIIGTDKPGSLTTFTVASDSEGEEAPQEAEAPAKATPRSNPNVAERPPESVPEPEFVPPVRPKTDLPFLVMSKEEYRAAQISNLPNRSSDTSESRSDGGRSSGGGMPNDSELAGRGPKGQPLYAAEWYVRPTDAQLQTYIGNRARSSGWGLIACRTVAGYRVEDCQELGESPRGSGLAGAVRQAAWQFRVRPPRIGGKEQVGEWVSIRIDYTIRRE